MHVTAGKCQQDFDGYDQTLIVLCQFGMDTCVMDHVLHYHDTLMEPKAVCKL